MKRNLSISVFLMLLVALSFTSCDEPTPPSNTGGDKVSAIELSPKEAKLEVGETLKLQVQLTPALKKEVTFESSAPSVASVSAEGVVTALSKGSAEITARVDAVASKCLITVTPKEEPKPQAPFEIVITQTTATNVFVTIKPQDPKMRYCVWGNTQEAYDETINKHGSIPESNRKWWEFQSREKAGGKRYREAVALESYTGEQNINIGEISGGAYPFPDDHKIVIVVYGMDEDGFETTSLVTQEENTKPSKLTNLTFDVKINGIHSNSVDAVITPSDNSKEYFYSIQSARFVNFYLNPKPDKEIIDGIPSKKYMCLKLIHAAIENEQTALAIRKGPFTISEETNNYLKPDTPYFIIVYGWSKEDGITTDISLTPFDTTPNE